MCRRACFNLISRLPTLVLIIVQLLLLLYCLHPSRFAAHYNFIKARNITLELQPAYWPKLNSCKSLEVGITRNPLLYPRESPTENSAALARRLHVLPGGKWQPQHCRPIFHVAIVLPYRNRIHQLNVFVNYIHSFLQAQNLHYMIFVIEQIETKLFNRAKLFNVGFSEAIKIANFPCFIFHDIDLIPQNLENIYACTKFPRHMSSSVNTFRYNLPYTGLFGGAISISKHQFQKVNGFSNVFFGWGGEDDDFYSRLQSKGYPVMILNLFNRILKQIHNFHPFFR